MSLSAVLAVEPTSDSVTFRFDVTNDGTDPVVVEFRSAKHADVVVSEDGDEVWRWSDGQLFAQMLQPATFDPGHTESYEFEWADPDPGAYEAVATLNATQDVRASASFSV